MKSFFCVIIIIFLTCETKNNPVANTGNVSTTPINTPNVLINNPPSGTTPTGVTAGGTTQCKDTNYANYTAQVAAQAAYLADPTCRADLDADKDGIA